MGCSSTWLNWGTVILREEGDGEEEADAKDVGTASRPDTHGSMFESETAVDSDDDKDNDVEGEEEGEEEAEKDEEEDREEEEEEKEEEEEEAAEESSTAGVNTFSVGFSRSSRCAAVKLLTPMCRTLRD